MINFTDIFIKRPVLATVVSLLILLMGLRAIYDLPVRQFPQVDNTLITVTTSYPGASAQVMQGFITTILEQSIASADGIDYMNASSTQSTSTINAYITLGYDPNTAFTDIMSKVAEVQDQLPEAALDPVITKTTGQSIALMYIGFSSNSMSPQQISDYLVRAVEPQLETIPGVSQAQVLGNRIFAMRVWLNPQKMAALGVTPTDVSNALAANNFQSAAGSTKGEFVAFDINANTDLHNVNDFKELVVKEKEGSLVRLQEVATVELGMQTYDASVIFNGSPAVFIGIFATPTANPLSVITQVRKALPTIEKNFPPALDGKIVYDATKYIRSSIDEVLTTIGEASLIVVAVIFLFLGSLRSIVIPIVTIPLSLIGVCSLMLSLGYSINLLTLLAMVLAIGLVVDDAIVVVENIHRHIEEEKLKPLEAALKGAREIATPIIAMTLTLAAVYAPIGFLGGLTGALFKEFAFTLASSVIISGIIALTLSPMMCSKLLKAENEAARLVIIIDKTFAKIRNFYHRLLHNILNYRLAMVAFAAVVLVSCFFLYIGTQKELAPQEDQSALFVMATAPEYANADYVSAYSNELNAIYKSFPQLEDYFIVNGSENVNQVFSGFILKPWNERDVTEQQIKPLLQQKVASIAGLQTVVFERPSLPSSDTGLPIQFVVESTADFRQVYDAAEQLKEAAQKSGLFLFVDNSLKYNNPQLQAIIDRSKAATLGITMQDIGQVMSNALGGNYVNFFSIQGRSYQVIPQIMRQYRLNPEDIENIYIKTLEGKMVPLSTVMSLKQIVEPNALTQFQQLNAATVQGVPAPGVTMGAALGFLKTQADKILPKNIGYDYSGQSRQYIEEGSTLMYTFIFALIVIYLVLAAQFESFRDPWIILISVPMSISGALIPLNLGVTTINIYSQIGLITLIGLISKHGILMVDFANKLQLHENLNIRDAIEKSATIRLRPILMTTAAMILGVIPLVLASGAGAESRFSIGVVISSGMFVGTMFTLFVVPTMYTLIAKDFHNTEK